MILESVSTSNFIAEKFVDFWDYTGFANFEWANLIMIAVGAFFIWLAIKKDNHGRNDISACNMGDIE